MSEEEIANVEVENDELSKEERLEAARKKYEELKKKKKKKGKKGKKKEDKEEDVDEQEKEDEDKDEKVEEDETKKEEEKEEVVEEKKEEIEEKKEETKEEKEVQPEPKDNKEVVKEHVEEETGDNTPESLVTPSEIHELKETISQQDKTIKKLRDENTDLKLSKMDMKDKINELESIIQQLKAGGSSITSPIPTQEFIPKKIEPAKQLITKNEYAENTQDFSDFNRTDDFREKLLLWKNWQVDMTQWNSTYRTEKITL